MILLKRMLLLNWYRFSHQIVPFGEISFLTGQNAIGKSTLIDAMQVVMLGETRGSFFNKAANEGGSRSLEGYLRCDHGDEGDSVRYLRRGRFTTHLAMEFFDDYQNSYVTLGVVFECFESEARIEHRFYIDNRPIPSHHWLDRQKRPFTIKDVKREIDDAHSSKGRRKAGVFERDRDYRDQIRRSLGDINERYFTLFKKAVPFTPIRDIRDFITQFVCDQEKVDVSALQENIDQYNKMGAYLDSLRARIDSLKKISEYHLSVEKEREEVRVYDYELDRLDQEQARRDRVERLNELEQLLIELDSAKHTVRQRSEERNRLNDECNILRGNVQSNDVKRQSDTLNKQIAELSNKIDEDRKTAVSLHQKLKDISGRGIRALENTVLGRELDFNDAALNDMYGGLCRASERLMGSLRAVSRLTLDDLMEDESYGIYDAQKDLNDFCRSCATFEDNIKTRIREKEQLLRDMEIRRIRLEKGEINYPETALRLKNALSAAIDGEVDFYADLLELRDESWRNAIEGFLNHTRLNLFLREPAKYDKAVRIYRSLCEKSKEYRYRIVDVQKLVREKFQARNGSAAQELISKHQGANAYTNYLLGQVMKADSANELNRYSRAMTRMGETYMGYSMGAIHPKNWEEAYIGKEAIVRQLQNICAKISNAQAEKRLLESVIGGLDAFQQRWEYSFEAPLDQLKSAQELYRLLPEKEKLRKRYETELEALDQSAIKQMELQISALVQRIEAADEDISKLYINIGSLESQEQRLQNDIIPELRAKEEAAKNRIATNPDYTKDWIEALETGRIQRIIEADTLPRRENVVGYRTRHETAMNAAQTSRKEARGVYNNEYSAGFDTDAASNAEYDAHLRLFSDVRLPEYERDIKAARDKAYEQFRAGFLNQMRACIDETKRSIAQINDALRSVAVGEVLRYCFLVDASTEEPFRRYYAMIMDDILQSNQLGWELFYEKYAKEVETLFQQIQVGGGGLLLDYKNYLQFDLEEIRKDGTRSRLSRSMGKKSGGETQMPFYIAVLASFAQLYGVNNPNYNKMRLIVFDEAFSKMDGARIRRSIELLRIFKLQAVLVAPYPKIGEISEFADINLAVFRQGDQTTIRSFLWKGAEDGSQEDAAQPAAEQG